MLKIIKKALGAVLEVAGVRVPGATEGQTLVANAEGVFVPGAGGGGSGPPLADFDPAALGSMDAGGSTYASRADHVHPMPAPSDIGAIAAPGSPTDGGVLARVAGTWVSTGAGSAGQHLKSNGAGAPTWETPAAVPSPAGSDPEPLGGADVGSSTAYARSDHVHPMPNASDVGAIAVADGLPTSEDWYVAAKEAWTLAAMLPTVNASNTTTGFPFRVTSFRACLGAKFFWNHATAVTVRVSLWNAAGTLLASKDVSVSGIGDYTGLFTSSVSLSAGTTYWIGIWETGSVRCMPGVSGSSSARFRVAPEPYRGWIRLGGYCSATGNARPSTSVLVEQPMLLVPLF